MNPTWKLINADVVEGLRQLPDKSVHCTCTSPPYYGLRNYQVDGQIGMEDTPEAYIKRLVEVFREVRRVLRDDGVLWLNLGASYAQSGMGGNPDESEHRKQATNAGSLISGRKTPSGYKPKDIIHIPFLVAEALRQDGWYWRIEMPWISRNKMPESVRDRPSRALEYVFLLTKKEKYFFDMEAVKKPTTCTNKRGPSLHADLESTNGNGGLSQRDITATRSFRSGDLWFESLDEPHGLVGLDDELVGLDVNVGGYEGAHFATWPTRLITPLIKAGTSSEGCCPECLTPYRRIVERNRQATREPKTSKLTDDSLEHGNRDPERHVTETRTLGWEADCKCNAGRPIPCTVLDCFAGSSTTLAVSIELGRSAVGIELNPAYIELGKQRIAESEQKSWAPLFTEQEPALFAEA